MEEDLKDTKRDSLLEGEHHGGYLQTVKGVVLSFTSVFIFTTYATCVQLLERRIPDFELNSFRFGIPLLLYTMKLLFCRLFPRIERDKIGVVTGYLVVLFIAAFSYFISISLLPAALVSSIGVASSIISALALFSIFWREKLTILKLVLATLCVIGVAMVTQPKLDGVAMDTEDANLVSLNGTGSYRHWNRSEEINQDIPNNAGNATDKVTGLHAINFEELIKPDTLAGKIVGHVFAVIAGITLSLSVLINKRNPYINDSFAQVLFWVLLFNTLTSLLLMALLENPMLPSNWFDVTMIIVQALSSAVMWPLYMYIPKYISGSTFTLIISTEVIFMLISQYTVLSSILPGHRNWIEVVGVICVLLGSSMSSVLEIFGAKTVGEPQGYDNTAD